MARLPRSSGHMHRMAAVGAALISLALTGAAHEGHQATGGHAAPPAAAPVEKRAALTPAESTSFHKTVQRFVRDESAENGGVFVVHDEKLDKDWNLRLIRLRADSIGQVSQKLFTICADFKEAGGKARLDIDFLVNRTGAGWAVRQPVIHAVNGETRRPR